MTIKEESFLALRRDGGASSTPVPEETALSPSSSHHPTVSFHGDDRGTALADEDPLAPIASSDTHPDEQAPMLTSRTAPDETNDIGDGKKKMVWTAIVIVGLLVVVAAMTATTIVCGLGLCFADNNNDDSSKVERDSSNSNVFVRGTAAPTTNPISNVTTATAAEEPALEEYDIHTQFLVSNSENITDPALINTSGLALAWPIFVQQVFWILWKVATPIVVGVASKWN